MTNYTEPRVQREQVTIANGGTASTAVDLKGCTLCGFSTPASLTGTAMTFQTTLDGTNWLTIKDSAGADVSFVVESSKYYVVSPANFAGIRDLRLVSGSAETGAKIINLFLRQV